MYVSTECSQFMKVRIKLLNTTSNQIEYLWGFCTELSINVRKDKRDTRQIFLVLAAFIICWTVNIFSCDDYVYLSCKFTILQFLSGICFQFMWIPIFMFKMSSEMFEGYICTIRKHVSLHLPLIFNMKLTSTIHYQRANNMNLDIT